MAIPKTFRNNNEIERIKTLGKYELLYENDQESVLQLHERIKKQYKDAADLLYVAHAVPARITEFYGDFVRGDEDHLSIEIASEDESEQARINEIVQNNDLATRIYDYANIQSTYGFGVLLGRVEEGVYKIDSVDPDQYFPQADGSVVFATYIRDPKAEDMPERSRELFLYTQHYRQEGNTVVIERRAWSTDPVGRAADVVSLEKVGIDAEEEERIENMTRLPIVQFDNGARTRFGFGKSDYADIMPQLAEINERTTQVATQLLKNVDAIMEMQNNPDLLDDDGSIKPFDTVMLPDKDAAKTRYVTNDNPLIGETNTHVDRALKFVSWVTAVPMWELMEGSRPEKVESLEIRLHSAVRKNNTKRGSIKRAINDIIKIGFEMLDEDVPEEEIKLHLSSVIPHDPLAEAQVEQIKVSAGLSSRVTAMKRLEHYTDEEAEAELERINGEDIQAGGADANNPPQL